MDKFFELEAQVHLMFFYQDEESKPDTTKHAWMQQEGGKIKTYQFCWLNFQQELEKC